MSIEITKTTDDLISVIVPVYNIEKYIGLCIESLIKQTYQSLEIILVDDGSSDRSPDICDLYASKDDRIRVIHKENGGLVSARKAGLREATGFYISCVDGDDWIEPEFCEVMHRDAVRTNAEVVCAGYSKDIFEKSVKCFNNVPDGLYHGEELEKLFSCMISFDDFFSFGITTYVWNKLFKRDLLQKVQFDVDDQVTIGEDAAVTYPALLIADRVYVCDYTGYHYRQREDSMLKSHSALKPEIRKIKTLDDYLRPLFERNEHRDILLPQLDDCILANCIMRSGGILSIDEKTLFGATIAGKRIAIVRAGSFGQGLYKRLKQSSQCEVVGWYDEDYWEYRRCGLNVDHISTIKDVDFDYLLVAKLERDEVRAIKQKINIYGITDIEVLSIYYPMQERAALIERYWDIVKNS